MMKKVRVEIRPDGSAKGEAHGYSGKGCQADVEKMLEGFGDTVDAKSKPEFYAKAPVQNRKLKQ